MKREKRQPVQACLVVLLAGLLLAACGGGGASGTGPGTGGNDGDGTGNPAPVAGDCAGSGSVTITGTAEYEFVPAVGTLTGARLDYAAAAFRPIRAAEVQAVCAGSSEVFASTVTDDEGAFSLVVPGDVDVGIRVRAVMINPVWNVQVVDNTRGQAAWSAQGESIDSGTENFEVTLRLLSGWDGSSTYSEVRAAAPFAILDSVYTAMQKVLEADPGARFPALKLNWSPDNRTCTGEDFPFADGCIGTSFYANYGGSAGRNIFILGDAGNDTDEYDNHVILHEWGHYYEDVFSRSDSIGGAHGGGDVLDPRVAFGEGWGNAFSGIATDDPVYVDTRGARQGSGFTIDVENDEGSNPGWWNESSVQAIIYDLYDNTPLEDAADVGFAAIHAVLKGGQESTEAMTTLFPFIRFLRESSAAAQAAIDSVVAAHGIAVIDNEWGDGRQANDDGSEFGAKEFVSPIYTDLVTTAVADGDMHRICTTNAIDPLSASEYNRLGARRFLRFSVDSPGQWRISVAGDTAANDPDFFVWLAGAEQTDSGGAASVSGTNFSAEPGSGAANPDGVAYGTEVAAIGLSSNTVYVLEVMDWLNVDDDGNTGGDTCLDITFEAP